MFQKRKILYQRILIVILLILIAGFITKTFLVTSYHVPTASMEETIIPGDHIIVEKYIPGSRISLSKKTIRFSGVRSVRRGDILVFNVPKEDSAFLMNRKIDFYQWKNGLTERELLPSPNASPEFVPVKFRTPYVKRVIACPGDTLTAGDIEVKINHQHSAYSNTMRQEINLLFPGLSSFNLWKNKLYHRGEQVRLNHADRIITGVFRFEDIQELQKDGIIIQPVTRFPDPDFIPSDYSWAMELARKNRGIIIPAKGWTTSINAGFIETYGSLIRRFEPFHGKVENGVITDEAGLPLQKYTFRQDYYWCMGDNRPYSIDSRTWGLVPEDHIIGISRRIFWSKDPEASSFWKKFRWSRFMKRI